MHKALVRCCCWLVPSSVFCGVAALAAVWPKEVGIKAHEIINYSVESGNNTLSFVQSGLPGLALIMISVYCFLPGGSGPICRIYCHLKRHSTESYPSVIML